MQLDLRAFRLGAIKKAAYRFADRCTVVFGAESGHTLDVELRFKTATAEASAIELTRLFHQELLDQELREQVAEETAPVRALILAHAFSKADLIKRRDR